MTLTAGIVVALVLLSITPLWLTRFDGTDVPVSPVGRRLTWGLLVVYTMLQCLVFDYRSDPEDLVASGLSFQNKLQAAMTLLLVARGAWLVMKRRVPLTSLVQGPGFWVAFLILTFAVSVSWSIWPEFTLYRTAELAAMWVAGAHVFPGPGWFVSCRTFLALVVVLTMLGSLLLLALGEVPFTGNVVGVLSSNPGGCIACALFLCSLHRSRPGGGRRDLAGMALSIVAVVLFGSLAATAALVLALLLIVVLDAPRYLRPLLAAGLVGMILLNFYYLFLGLGDAEWLLETVARAFGKQPKHIFSMSGRLPLWNVVWEVTKDHPFGLGFAAAERTFVVLLTRLRDVGWNAKNAHSGYVSAWLGAGWPGLLLVAWLLASLWRRLARVDPRLRPLLAGLLLLVAINNFTVAGIGGQYGPVFMLVMAICRAPAHAAEARRVLAAAPAARPRLVPAIRW
jgi:hypothetical protein